MSFRYKGSETAVVFIDGAAWPVDPHRIYDADYFVVKSRPDLFVRQSGSKAATDDLKSAQTRIAELEAEVATLTADLDAQVEAHAERDADEVAPPADA